MGGAIHFVLCALPDFTKWAKWVLWQSAPLTLALSQGERGSSGIGDIALAIACKFEI